MELLMRDVSNFVFTNSKLLHHLLKSKDRLGVALEARTSPQEFEKSTLKPSTRIFQHLHKIHIPYFFYILCGSPSSRLIFISGVLIPDKTEEKLKTEFSDLDIFLPNGQLSK